VFADNDDNVSTDFTQHTFGSNTSSEGNFSGLFRDAAFESGSTDFVVYTQDASDNDIYINYLSLSGTNNETVTIETKKQSLNAYYPFLGD